MAVKSRGAAHPLEGKKAPAFALPATGGSKVALKSLIGERGLVLYFYPKDLTSGCSQEACDFRDNLKTLNAAGVEVVGLSFDPPMSHQKFTAKYNLNFRLLTDADKKVATAYGVYKKKSLYGRQFMGIERTTFVIDRTGVIRKVFPKVKVEGHAEAVIKAVAQLD